MHIKANSVGNTAIRHMLRTQTQEVHEQLHRHASFAGLLNGALDLAGYRELVKRLYGFYRPLDKAINSVLTNSPQFLLTYSYTDRSTYLERDLLDLDVTTESIDRLPLCHDVHDIVSPQSLGGVLYVIDGATRGGSLISKAAMRLLGGGANGGLSYWLWCRSEQNRQWKQISALLAYLSSVGAEPADLVDGAADTFRLFSDWMMPLDKPISAESSVM